MYSESIADAFIKYLREDGWTYDFDKDRGVIKTGVIIDSKLKKCLILIDINESDIISYGLIDIKSDKENKANMSELLHRINYELKYGCFEFDFSDGEIRFRISMDCEDIDLTQDMIQKMLTYPVITIEKFSDALLKVLFNLATPEEALNEVEKVKLEEEKFQDKC